MVPRMLYLTSPPGLEAVPSQAAVCHVMSHINSRERVQMVEALGSEVVLVDQQPGATLGQVSGQDLPLVAERAEQIARGSVPSDSV